MAVFGLPEWRELLTVDGPVRLTPAQVEQAAHLLEPKVKVASPFVSSLLDSFQDADGYPGEYQHGLVHGDVSPRNLIVQGGTVVLTDYDKANQSGIISAIDGVKKRGANFRDCLERRIRQSEDFHATLGARRCV